MRDILQMDEVQAQFEANNYPNWLVNQVNNSSVVAGHPNDKDFTRSARETLEKERDYYERLNMRIVDGTVRHLLREDSIRLAIDFLENQDNTRTSCAVIPLLHAVNDTLRMNDYIERVRSDADAEESENPNCVRCDENRALCAYFELLSNITFNQGLENITQQQLQTISSFAATDRALAVNFRNILDYLDEQDLTNTLWQPINFGSIQKNNAVETTSPAGQAEPKEEAVLLLYPNPAEHIVTIQFNIPNSMGNTTISMYDLTGRILLSNNLPEKEGNLNLSVLNIPNGIYLVVLSDANGRHKTQKLVVNH